MKYRVVNGLIYGFIAADIKTDQWSKYFTDLLHACMLSCYLHTAHKQVGINDIEHMELFTSCD